MPLPFQSKFLYRPRRNSPAPTRMGFAGDAGIHRLRPFLGSLSPKLDWALPRYVRRESDGVAGIADDIKSGFNTISSGLQTAANTAGGVIQTGTQMWNQAQDLYDTGEELVENFQYDLTGGGGAPPDYQQAPPPPDVINPMPAPPVSAPIPARQMYMMNQPGSSMLVTQAIPGATPVAGKTSPVLLIGGIALAAIVLTKLL